MRPYIYRLGLFLLTACISMVAATQNSWPKEIALKTGGKVIIYQPQPDDLSGNKLKGRSAVSIKQTNKDEPIFGAIFYEATLNTNKDTRMADLESLLPAGRTWKKSGENHFLTGARNWIINSSLMNWKKKYWST